MPRPTRHDQDLPLEFLCGDLRHLPDLQRPGPALRRAQGELEQGRRPPRGAASAECYRRAAARGFWSYDDRLQALAVDQATSPTAHRSRSPYVADYLASVSGCVAPHDVVASVAAERRDNAHSYNAFVTQLERQARFAYLRRTVARCVAGSTVVLATVLGLAQLVA